MVYTSSVMHGGQIREPFMIKSWVKQSWALSPILFVIVLDNIMRSADQQHQNLNRRIQGGRLGDRAKDEIH